MGAINFYRRHLKNAADVQPPLNDLLKDSKQNDRRPGPWTKEAFIAWSDDASSTAMGAVLGQKKNNLWQPLGIYSKKLSPSQKNYSTCDRELTAIYEAINIFYIGSEGENSLFVLTTNHLYSLSTSSPINIRLDKLENGDSSANSQQSSNILQAPITIYAFSRIDNTFRCDASILTNFQ